MTRYRYRYSAAQGDAAFPTAGTIFVGIFLLPPRFLVFLSTHCGQSHAPFALRRSIQPAAIASARLPGPEPESNQAARASPTCEGLSHVSSTASRPAPIPKIFTPIICKPFSMKGALDTNPAWFHSDNCHKKSLLGLPHKELRVCPQTAGRNCKRETASHWRRPDNPFTNVAEI